MVFHSIVLKGSIHGVSKPSNNVNQYASETTPGPHTTGCMVDTPIVFADSVSSVTNTGAC